MQLLQCFALTGIFSVMFPLHFLAHVLQEQIFMLYTYGMLLAVALYLLSRLLASTCMQDGVLLFAEVAVDALLSCFHYLGVTNNATANFMAACHVSSSCAHISASLTSTLWSCTGDSD